MSGIQALTFTDSGYNICYYRMREKVKIWIWRFLQVLASFQKRNEQVKRSFTPSLVLVPCEPGSVIGSRGDEAMVYSVLTSFRERNPDGRIMVITSHPDFPDGDDAKRLNEDFPGIEFVPAWRGHFALCRMYRTIRRVKATEVYALGADCMDGYYDDAVSIYLLAVSDLSTRLNIKTTLTGFSWNTHPTAAVCKAFKYATKRVTLNLRDPVSYERFVRQIAGTYRLTARLVADVAFNLIPKTLVSVTRQSGKKILAFNLHGMLVAKDKYQELVDGVARGLNDFVAEHPEVQVVLVPHDYRPQGDLDALTQIHGKVPNTQLVSDVLSAAELKGLMSSVDGLFTSRMHLGIAALGQGKPIGAFAYQGKFTGLFRHFGLPEDMVLNPAEMDRLPKVLDRFIRELPMLTRQVQLRIPAVKEMAGV